MYQGSCLCGSIRYVIDGELSEFGYCHCQSCRKASGSAFGANIAVPVAAFRVTQGDALVGMFESSPGKRRHFCTRCGSPLYTLVGEAPTHVRVRLGCLDDDYSEPPSAQIFTDDGAAWHRVDDAAPQYPGWPDPAALAIPGSRQAK